MPTLKMMPVFNPVHNIFFISISLFLLSLVSCKKSSGNEGSGDRSGIYAVYSTGAQWNNRNAYLWKDDVQTNLTNQDPLFNSTGTNIYVTGVAVTSSGDVYVAGAECLKRRQDITYSSEFIDSCYTIVWKNGIKQNLNSTAINRWFMKGDGVDLAINSNDDVFVLGRDSGPAAADYAVWKNGSKVLDFNDDYADISTLFVKGNDVYFYGRTYVGGANVAAYWKNGNRQLLSSDSYVASVYVADNNDVWLGLGNGKILLNNVEQPLHSASGSVATNISTITGKGNDIYVMGITLAGESIIWKNGVQLYKMETAVAAYNRHNFQSFFIHGNDVYASGVLSSNSGSSSAAVIYKNGILYKTLYEGNGLLVDAPCVFVK